MQVIKGDGRPQMEKMAFTVEINQDTVARLRVVAVVGRYYLSHIVTEALNAYLPAIPLSPQQRALVRDAEIKAGLEPWEYAQK